MRPFRPRLDGGGLGVVRKGSDARVSERGRKLGW